MESDLATKSFNISTPYFSYPVKFVAPVWAQGFECQSGQCGLCCLTQLPPEVSQIHNAELDLPICRVYDIKNRFCKKYVSRPIGCKIYPFLFGVEERQILISSSLECPGTSSGTVLKEEGISNLFDEPYVTNLITHRSECYEYAIRNPNLWGQAYEIRNAIVRRLKDYFRQRIHFPILPDVIDLVWETFTELTKQEIPKNHPISVQNAIKNTGGIYIATRTETYGLGLVKVKGSIMSISLFDNNLKISSKTRIKTPTKFSDLELDKGAQQLLNDYVSLNCSRPFLSLAAILASSENIPVPINLIRILTGSFVSIETGATIIAHRDRLETIDRETMREIIGFSDALTHGAFVNPASCTKRI